MQKFDSFIIKWPLEVSTIKLSLIVIHRIAEILAEVATFNCTCSGNRMKLCLFVGGWWLVEPLKNGL